MSLATDIAEAEARDRPRVKAEAIAQAHNAAGKQIGFKQNHRIVR